MTIKLSHPSEIKQLEIEPTTYENFIASLSAALTPFGAILPSGEFIPAWFGTASQCAVWPQPALGIDNGTRIKLHKPLTYPEVCSALEVNDKGLWADTEGNRRRIQVFGGKSKRIFAPKVKTA